MTTAAKPPRCIYPQSSATQSDIFTMVDGLASNQSECTSIYLPTAPGMSEGGEDHYQGLARTQKLSDGSVYFFLVHSDMGFPPLFTGHGRILQYRYQGPIDGDHVLDATPPAYATLEQQLFIDSKRPERHPSDIAFLPDVNELDSGYLFVTEEYDNYLVSVYRWKPHTELVFLDYVYAGYPSGGPQFVFLDRVGDDYYLGIASEHWGWGQLLCASAERLFPKCAHGSLDVSAFKPAGMFPFPVMGGACQTKLIRDHNDDWYLLAYRSVPNDDQNGEDYIDIFGVQFNPFVISYKLASTHISLRPGDTGFANSGTHYVEQSGRLLVSSSYRWDRFHDLSVPPHIVCRIDELPFP